MTTTTPAGTLATDDVGTGEPALLCIPGWCGDRSVFDPVRAGLSEHRRTINVDLPDHGGSPGAGSALDTAPVVEAMVEVVNTAGVDRVVPVSLSHAGWIGIELRRRLGPDRVPALVWLDWMVLGPPPGFLEALAGLQEEASWSQVRSGLFAMWTSGTDVAALHSYVDSMGTYGFGHWRRAGREISAAFAAEGSPLAAMEALAEPCPTLHVYAQPADDALLTSQQEYAMGKPWFTVRRLAAQSHFPTFEVPQDVVTAVEEFVCRLP